MVKLSQVSQPLVIQSFDDSGNKDSSLAQIFQYDEDRIKTLQSRGAGIYWCINPQFDKDKRGISNTTSFEVVGLDVDVSKEKDKVDDETRNELKNSLYTKLISLPIPPTGIIDTKNGLQPYWKFSDPLPLDTSQRASANEVYKKIVKAFSRVTGIGSEGDSISRVLRLPGTKHLKNPYDQYEIDLIYQGQEITRQEFKDAYSLGELDDEQPYKGNETSNLIMDGELPVVTEGARNNVFISVAGVFLSNMNPKLWEAVGWPAILEYNRTCVNPPFPESLVRYKWDKLSHKELLSRNLILSNNEPVLKEEALHGLAGEIVRELESTTESDPVALLVNFLVGYGSSLGRTAFTTLDSAKHYGNLYTVLVGRSSMARKGTSWHNITQILEKVDQPWFNNVKGGGLSSAEGLIAAVRDKQVVVKTNKNGDEYEEVIDQGVEDKRLLVVEGEFASVLSNMKRDGNNLSALLRNAWDSGNLATLTKNPMRATNAHVSLIGHITMDELISKMTATEMANGFANRFMWFYVKRSKKLPHGGMFTDNKNLSLRVRSSLSFAKTVSDMDLSNEARKYWSICYDELTEELQGEIGQLLVRSAPQVRRLACLYALLDTSSTVELEHLTAAMALWRYNKDSISYLWGGRTGDSVADRILMALQVEPNGLTKTDIIIEVFQKNKPVHVIDKALEFLVGSYRIVKTKEEGTTKNIERYKLIK